MGIILIFFYVTSVGVNINPMYKGKELKHIIVDSSPKVLIALSRIYKNHFLPLGINLYSVLFQETDFVPEESREKYRILFEEERVSFQVSDSVSIFQELLESYKKVGKVEEASLFADDIAFLTYTSGTTAGLSKGACNTHRNFVYSSRKPEVSVSLSHEDVVLSIAPMFHITGLIVNMGIPLALGSPVVLNYRFHPVVTAHLIEKVRTRILMSWLSFFSFSKV